MAKIFYSLSGEGRGHASRARCIIDDLHSLHDITVYAPGHAYDMLEPLYRTSRSVKVIRIPGLMFHYNERKRLDYGITALKAIDYYIRSSKLVKDLCRDIDREKPELIITDFEPALPKAAERCQLPYISINHQHFLLTYDLSSLPPLLQQRAAVMGSAINLFYRKQVKTIVSSFYFPPLKPFLKDVFQVGVFLNKKIRSLTPGDNGSILVYLRRFSDKKLLTALNSLNRRIIIYNNEANERHGNLEFKLISPFTFLEDLASCSCLVSTAGNQLVGEAMYLGKPVLAMPEPDNFEQEINGRFLAQSGAGIDYSLDSVTPDILRHFLSNLSAYSNRIDRERICGNAAACSIISRMIEPPQMKEDLYRSAS